LISRDLPFATKAESDVLGLFRPFVGSWRASHGGEYVWAWRFMGGKGSDAESWVVVDVDADKGLQVEGLALAL
jgi:hypothetical protein